MKEKVQFDERNAFNLFYRLIRVFSFSIQIRENELNYTRLRSDVANRMAYRIWFSYVFDELDKNSYSFGLNLYSHYDIETYNRLMRYIVDRLVNHLHNIEKKPKKQIYMANYDFLLGRLFFKCLYNYLYEFNEWFNNKYVGRAYRVIPNRFGFVGDFTDNFVLENIFYPEEFCENINQVLKYFGYKNFSLSADGILRYFDATAEGEEKKRSYLFLHKKKFANVIESLDKVNEHISKGDFNNALGECRNTLEAFFKRLLLNHKIRQIDRKGKTIKTEEGDAAILAEAIRKNIVKIFEFPKYSKNIEESVRSLLESSKFFISGMANPAGSHGQNIKVKVKLKEVKAAESYLILLFNSLIPFEK